MSRKANPTLIGAFVLGGVALLIAGVLVFGGKDLFQRKPRFVTYFEGSVQGLRVGSNVLFRGVRIGYVTDIQLTADQSMLNYEIPVIFEIIPDAVKLVSDGKAVGNLMTGDSHLQDMIQAGLRTQLDVESFVTGQLVVNLDMHPEAPAVFHGHPPAYPEIPSIQSGMQQVLKRVQAFVTGIQEKVPVERIVEELMSAINGFDQLVNSPDLKQALAGINRVVNARETQDLPGALTGAIADLRAATRDARGLIGRTDQRLEPVLERAVPAIEQFERTLREGQEVLSLARAQLASNPETAEQLAKALREVERSARAIRILVDYLERQPESVLRGKTNTEEKP